VFLGIPEPLITTESNPEPLITTESPGAAHHLNLTVDTQIIGCGGEGVANMDAVNAVLECKFGDAFGPVQLDSSVVQETEQDSSSNEFGVLRDVRAQKLTRTVVHVCQR
jgi:hypothetical protein